jgi:hypothetical protein
MKVTWKDLQRADWMAGAWAAAAVMACCLLFGAIPQAIVGSLAAGYLTALQRRRYMAALHRRAEASSGPQWTVELNGVKVGEVSDAEYAGIRLAVFTDMRLYTAQFRNSIGVLARGLDAVLMLVPTLTVWGLLVVAMFAPESAMQALRALQAATAAELGTMARRLAAALLVMGGITALFNTLVTGARYGFVNRFAEATGECLRRQLGVAARGEIRLVRWVEGVAHINDERAVLRHGE